MTIIKIGGRTAENDRVMTALADDLAGRLHDGEKILLVHGGGSAINRLQETHGFIPRFQQGRRRTSPEEMALVDMALAGAVNKRLVRIFCSRKIASWGLCGADGGIMTGKRLFDEDVTDMTGVVTEVSMHPLELLWKGNFLPIMAPPSMDASGAALNINADEAALALAKTAQASRLIFLSDVPGVLNNGKIMPSVTMADSEKLIAEGVVSTGMIPKLRSAVDALKAGVHAVHIAAYGEQGEWQRILDGRQGTRIIGE
ncbi:MAG: acetylglutamate kinase [spirochete symbiont of Stewartia floridana]|nr:MAG: acetylglutamate kinase [spirochete symbiont of Stewartia floridana]